MRVDRRLIAFNKRRTDNVAVHDFENSQRAVIIFHGKLASGILRHKIHLTCREVGDIRCLAPAEAVAFLGFLTSKSKPCGQHAPVFQCEVHFDLNGTGHCLADALRIGGDFIIIYCKT